MKKFDLIILISAVVFCVCTLFHKNKVGDYFTEYYYDCIVTHKLETGAGYKVSAKFILVLKDDKGRSFDITVTPTCWANAEVGEKLTFLLSENMIQADDGKNSWSFFLFLIRVFCVVAAAIWVMGRISMRYED